MNRAVGSRRHIGRKAELEVLASALEACVHGDARTVFVSGPAGIGKTRLIGETMRRWGDNAPTILIGSCIALSGGDVPFLPLREAFGHEFAGLWADADLGTRVQLFESTLDRLEQLSHNGPVVLVIEDLHWSDRSTLDLLAFLIHNLRSQRVLVVVSYRSDDLPSMPWLVRWVNERARLDSVVHIDVPPFGAEDVIEHATDVLGTRPSPDVTDRVLVRSDGNPLFVEELLASDPHASGALPENLKVLLSQRFSSLSASASSVVRAAAIAGSLESEELLADMTELTQDEVFEALRELGLANVLVVDIGAGGYEFRHPLLQEAAYEGALPGERKKLHAAAAESLSRRGDTDVPTLALLAHHYRHSGLVAEAAAAARRAAEAEEAAYAYAEQARDLQILLDLWDEPGVEPVLEDLERSDVMLKAAGALHLAGENDLAIEMLERAVKIVPAEDDPLRSGVLYERLGWYRSIGAAGEQATEAFERALALIPPTPSLERARLLGELALQRAIWGETDAARRLVDEALEMAAAIGAPTERGRALTALGTIHTREGLYDPAIELLATARDILVQAGDDENTARSHILLADALFRAERWNESVEVCLAGFEIARRAGLVRYYGSFLQASAAEVLIRTGRWSEAEELLNQAAARTDQGVAGLGIGSSMAQLAIMRGDLDRAGRILEGLSERSAELYPEMRAEIVGRESELLLASGHAKQAASMALDALRHIGNGSAPIVAGQIVIQAVRVAVEVAEDARARADKAAQGFARSVIDRALASAAGAGWVLGDTQSGEVGAQQATVKAELARLEREWDADAWEHAARRWGELSAPYEQAVALFRQGEAVLNSRGPVERARHCLVEAARTARALGAGPLIERITSLAGRARLDLEGRQSVPKASEEDGLPHGLTLRELEVLVRIAEGATNRQIAEALFISPKTASAHVSHILQKLGASSRVEAAAIAHRMGLARDDLRVER